MRRSRFGWWLMYAVQVHVLVAALIPRAPAPAVASVVDPDDIVDAPELPATVASGPAIAKALAIPAPARHPGPRGHGAPPALASSAIALPDVGEPLPVASASAYPGGVTAPQGTTDSYVGELGGDGMGWGADLSRPARLGGEKHWGCTVAGVHGGTRVNFRALVRADGSPVRLEPIDGPGQVPDAVLAGALPCAMREHFIAGRDRLGRPAERWSLPFGTIVVGILE